MRKSGSIIFIWTLFDNKNVELWERKGLHHQICCACVREWKHFVHGSHIHAGTERNKCVDEATIALDRANRWSSTKTKCKFKSISINSIKSNKYFGKIDVEGESCVRWQNCTCQPKTIPVLNESTVRFVFNWYFVFIELFGCCLLVTRMLRSGQNHLIIRFLFGVIEFVSWTKTNASKTECTSWN